MIDKVSRRGVFTKGEDTHTLRLNSELFDLRVGYANPILRLGESQRGVREPLTVAKNKGHPQGVSLFFWRRKRDSNPRAFWANGFQDRLVVTASIFLHIYGVVYYTIYMQSDFEVARETRFTNPLRIPHEDASSSLVSGKCGYPRQR